MSEKLAYAAEHLAWVPGLLLGEPRGHKDLFGAVLVPPSHPEAAAGVLFMDNVGYEPACGHATIGTITCLLAAGIVEAVEPETHLVLDTAAGPVRASVAVRGGEAEHVTFENVPAFVYRRGVDVSVPGVDDLLVDVAFGGNFFAMVDVAANGLDLDLAPAASGQLADWGMRILAAVNERVAVRHPELTDIERIIDLRFYRDVAERGVDSRNVVVLGDHMIDRSPCGTGTCAEMALRHARGTLDIGEDFVSESILGTRFTGRLVGLTTVGEGDDAFAAVRPRITGSAYVTGFHNMVLQPRDPFPEGFLLGT
jgi:proline racemase